jgi:hypothetical protein
MTKKTKQESFQLRGQIKPMEKTAYNPWLREYPKKARYQHHHTATTSFVVGTDEDQKPVATFTNTYPVDKEQFCKIWVGALEANVTLTTAGRKVFLVLFLQLQKNIGRDMVQMSFAHCKEVRTEIKQATYTRGVRDLYDNQFIKPVEGMSSTWWVNPDYIFKGNRLSINNTYIMKDTVDNETGEISTEEAYGEAA